MTLYMCGFPGCKQTFTLEKDLKRHQLYSKAHRDQHLDEDEPRSEDIFVCSEQTCKFYRREYTRLDNYMRHVRTMHGNGE